MYDSRWGAIIVDEAAQIVALAELLAAGLLTPDEFEQQKAKVFEA
jgi:hypothetical protein